MERLKTTGFSFLVLWLVLLPSVVFGQGNNPPNRPTRAFTNEMPSTIPSAWDIVPTQTIEGDRIRSQWSGALGFELMKKSVGSGRFFGQAVRLPYAHIDLIGESGEVLNPCDIISDGQGIFRFTRVTQTNTGDCRVPPGMIKFIRLKGHSRRDMNDFGFKFTHGYTFSPFEATCANSSWTSPCTGEERRQLFQKRLNDALDCVRKVAHNDQNSQAAGCTVGELDAFDVDWVGLLHELVSKRTIVTDAIDEWKQTDEFAELLSIQYDRQVKATKETWQQTLNGIRYQENLARAELDETKLAYAQAKRCASRCRSWEKVWCIPKCTLGFLMSEIKSKVAFLKNSVQVWASITVGWVTVGARWANQIFITTPVTAALWVVRLIGGDLPLANDFLGALYSTVVLTDRMLEMTGQAAQLAIGLADFYGSMQAPFLILELISELEDLINNPTSTNALEVIEDYFLKSTSAYGHLKAIAAVADIAFFGELFPKRPRHYVDIPVIKMDLNRGVVHTAVMSPAYSNPDIPIEDDLPHTLGWQIANWSYRLERARDVLYQPGEGGLSVYRTKERKDAVGVEVVWPTVGCAGAACYIGVDFDSMHMPPPLRTGHDIYIPNYSGYNNYLLGGDTGPVVHEFGHFVNNLLTGVDELGLDNAFSLTDLGQGHLECAPDSLSTHAAFGEGFASFVALLADGPASNTYLTYNPMTSETDYRFLTPGNPILQAGMSVKHVPWAATVAGIDDDGDGLPNIEEKSICNSNTSLTNADSDGDSFSDGYEYHLGSDAKQSTMGLQPSLQKSFDRVFVPATQKGGFDLDSIIDAKVCSDTGAREEARVSSILWNFVDIDSIPAHVKKTWYEHPCRAALGSQDCGAGYVCDVSDMTGGLQPFEGAPVRSVAPTTIAFRAFPDPFAHLSGTVNPDTFPTGMCRPRKSDDSCSHNYDCPRTQVCESGQCIQSCLTRLDCNGDEACTANRCVSVATCSQVGSAGSGAMTPDICHSGYYCLEGQCRKPAVPVDAMMRAVNHSNSPRLGVGAEADDICEYSEPLFDMVAMHDLQCDPSDTACADRVNYTIDNIYAYHTVGKARCGDGTLILSRQGRGSGEYQSEAGSMVYTKAEALTNGYSGLDRDRDGKLDGVDGCPVDFDPDAEYWDLSACDRDGDYIINTKDNCPDDWNPKQMDCDHDKIGNACDSDYAVRECSSISVVGGLNDSYLDIRLFTDSNSEEIEPAEVTWENIQLSLTEPEDVQDVISTLKSELSTHLMPCLHETEYMEQVNRLSPYFDVSGSTALLKQVGHGNGYNLKTSQPPFGSDVPRRYFQVRASWEDPVSGESMQRCSAPIDSSLFNQDVTEATLARLRNGTIVKLPMHYFYIEDASATEPVRVHIGHPGRNALYSVNVDLKMLGDRTGVTGHFFESKDEVSQQRKGYLYLYGGRLANGTVERDIWRVPILDWRHAGEPELVRDDAQQAEDKGLAALSNGWSMTTNDGVLMTGGSSNNGDTMRANVVVLNDGSVAQVPVAVQFNMTQQYVSSAPSTVVGTAQQRDPTCVDDMLYQVATQCPYQEVPVESCFDPADDPCTSNSPSYVAYTYSIDWNHMDCQAVLASCPVVSTSLVVADMPLASRTYGLVNHTAPSSTYGQSMVVVENKREVLVFGGESSPGSNILSNTLHRYSIEKGYYVEVDALNKPKARAWATVFWNEDTQTLYMLGGLSTGSKALYDLWAIEPFVQNPQWRRLSDNGVFNNRPLANARIIWDSDRDMYMLVGGADSIDPLTGRGVYPPKPAELLRFKIESDEVIKIDPCSGEACE